MTSADLRERFLAFFKQHDHAVVPSDSLIPSGDPTVLFTSAGMNQFKEYFLGKRTDLTRAASCQKCLRTGDLDNVGKTPSHHSFFEMLGNFSFGNYFKPEAIQWAWEFLTGTTSYGGPSVDAKTRAVCLSLPSEKLWVSVYEEDDEALRIWQELGVPKERIRKFGQKDNFWPANAPNDGPNGPCGPCSEIYFDPDGKVEGPKSVEVWNLVFTQFDRQSDGSVKPLPKPNIDTGMGLERLTRVIQGVETDYEIDSFAPVMAAIRALPRGNKVKQGQVVVAERAIADHVRAAVFLIIDGVLPSNESRGYILRMIIRRASRLGLSVLDVTDRRFLSSLTEPVEAGMRGSPYSKALAEKRPVIQQVLGQEERQFLQTLDTGIPAVEAAVAAAAKGPKAVSGAKAFEFYDTYGIPLELTIDIANEHGVTVDRGGYNAALQEQQQRSRKGSQFGGEVFTASTMVLKDVPKSEFVGYASLQADGTIKGIWKSGAWAQQAQQGEEVGIILDTSPFYGEAGGQIGDQGTLETAQGAADVLDTAWVDELLVHRAKVTRGRLAVASPVRAIVNADRRLKIARSHTATHLLHWALRSVLGPDAVQAGSYNDVERIRFDFSARGGLKEEQWATVEQLVNTRVRNADDVRTEVKDLEEAKQEGALALFGEKYGRKVRVVSIGDYSKEFCGGTHLRHTGSIGLFRLVSESSIAAGTRRVEAVVGEAAMDRQQEESRMLRRIAQQLSRSPSDALQGLEELLQQLRNTEKQLKSLKMEFAQAQAGKFVAQAKQIDSVKLVAGRMDGADREVLAALADAIKQAVSDGVTVLGSKERPDSVAWVMAVSPSLVKRGLHAGQMLKAIAAETGGSGGGRPEFAQAGGNDPSRIPQALSRAEELVRQALEKK